MGIPDRTLISPAPAHAFFSAPTFTHTQQNYKQFCTKACQMFLLFIQYTYEFHLFSFFFRTQPHILYPVHTLQPNHLCVPSTRLSYQTFYISTLVTAKHNTRSHQQHLPVASSLSRLVLLYLRVLNTRSPFTTHTRSVQSFLLFKSNIVC